MTACTTLEIVSTIIANGEARGLGFSGRDLAGMDLAGRDLAGRDLAGIDLSRQAVSAVEQEHRTDDPMARFRRSLQVYPPPPFSLSDINLEDADVRVGQLAQAESLAGATLPNGTDLSRDGWEEEFAEESERLRADFEACLRRQGDGQPPHHAAGSVLGG